MLRREHLIDFLVENQDSRLTIISAPAGYGKTTLLADYVSRGLKPSCWLTFDESDIDPAIFVESLVWSISRVYPQFGANGQLLLRLVEALHDLHTGPEVCGRLLVNQIYTQITEDFELVLDDHHIVENQPQLNELIGFFLNYLPDNCRVLLSCRSFTPLNLTSLMLRGEVVGIGTTELMMTSDEVHHLLADNYHLAISQHEAAELARQTEGWVTGILLGSQKVLSQRTNPDFANQEFLFNYLATKVLSHLPTHLSRFLLDTSVLEYLQADFCNNLLDSVDALECLRECERQHLFLSRVEQSNYPGNINLPGGSNRNYYRFHSLFRDFLLTQLKQTDPARFCDLHYRSASLFKEQGDTVQMMAHLLQTQDYRAITVALLSISEDQLKAGHSQSIESWLNGLPEVTLKAEPDLLLLKARALSLSGAFNQAYSVLEQLEVSLSPAKINAKNDLATAAHSLIQAKVFFWRGRILRSETRLIAAVESLEAGLAVLTRSGVPLLDLDAPTDPAAVLAHDAYLKLRSEIYLELGICLGINGQYRLAINALQQARLIEDGIGSKEHLAHIYQCLALAHNGLSETDIGQLHLDTSLKYWQEANNLTGIVDVLIILAGVYLNKADYVKAGTTLQQAMEQAQKGSYLSGQAYVLAYQGNLEIDLNQFKTAQNYYQQAYRLAEQANEKRLLVVVSTYQVSLWRALGNLPQATAVLEQALNLLPVFETNHSLMAEMLRLEQIGLALNQSNLSRAEGLLSDLSEQHTPQEFKRVLAIRYFLKARLLFAQKKHKLALDALVIALNYSAELGGRQVLKLEAIHALPLLQFAQARLGGQQLIRTAIQNLLDSLPTIVSSADQPSAVILALNEQKPLAFEAEALPRSALSPPAVHLDRAALPAPQPTGPTSNLTEHLVTARTLLANIQPHEQPLVVYALGTTRVMVFGTLVQDWRTIKASELLFFLVNQGKPVRKELILEAIWPEVEPTQADTLFRSTLHRLRKATSADWIKRQENTYGLNVAYWCDVQQLELLFHQGNRLNALNPQTPPAFKQAALECYQAAARLGRAGDYLNGMYSDWCIERQEALSALRLEILFKQAELELHLGLIDNALTTVGECLELDKCNEAAHLLRLHIYKNQANPTRLTHSYQLYTQALEKELGLRPAPEIKQFYMQALQQIGV